MARAAPKQKGGDMAGYIDPTKEAFAQFRDHALRLAQRIGADEYAAFGLGTQRGELEQWESENKGPVGIDGKLVALSLCDESGAFVVAEAGEEAGVPTVLCDNVPVTLDGSNLAEAVGRVANLTIERARARGGRVK